MADRKTELSTTNCATTTGHQKRLKTLLLSQQMKTETDWDPTRTNRLTDQQVNDLTIGFNAGDAEGRLEENKSLTFCETENFQK